MSASSNNRPHFVLRCQSIHIPASNTPLTSYIIIDIITYWFLYIPHSGLHLHLLLTRSTHQRSPFFQKLGGPRFINRSLVQLWFSHFNSFSSGYLQTPISLHLLHHQLIDHYLQLWLLYSHLITKYTPPTYTSLALPLIQHSCIFVPYTQLPKAIGLLMHFLLDFWLYKQNFPSAFQYSGLHPEPLPQSLHHCLLTQTTSDSHKD